jgi:hypothetical protein
MPSKPEFVLRPPAGRNAEIASFDAFPENAPGNEIIAEARWGALSMVVTPTCHVAEDEKDEDVVAVVPVEPLHVIVPNSDTKEQLRSRSSKRPHHLFYLPPTELSDRVLTFEAVAQLDRPGSFLKHELRDYRRLGLFREVRWELRKQLARFWPRITVDDKLDTELAAKVKNDVPLERLE